METLQNVIGWALSLGSSYIDLVCLIVGTAAGWVLSLIVEAFLLPDIWPRKTQQGATVLCNIIASTVCSALLWWALDPADRFGVRLAVSSVVALPSIMLYPAIARWATDRWPAIATSWVRK